MKFRSNHKVNEDTLDKAEAEAFIDFLQDERCRHRQEIIKAQKAILEQRITISEYSQAMIKFLESQIIRHEEDIAGIIKTVDKVKGRFG